MQNIEQLFDAKFIASLFAEKIPDFASKHDLSDLTAAPIKKYIGGDFYQIVIRYDCASFGYKPVFCTAHSKENRKNAFNALTYINNHALKQNNIFLPNPLFFDNEYGAFFYQGIDGKNLLHYIKKKEFDLTAHLKSSAELIAYVHEVPAEKAENFNPENSRIKTIVPGPENFLAKIEKLFPEKFGQIKENFYYLAKLDQENLDAKTNICLIHGDFHPENVIINEEHGKFSIIDFTDICLADWARDVGNFLQQLRFMSYGERSIDEIKKNQEIFLNAYLEKRSITKNSKIESRINLYKSWSALRSAIYFLIKGGPEPKNADVVLKEI
ncbi:aminoglycoside phosphotransferase family protein [Patescibacteria group bacterium]|nr:aminoglycoside phosphotransferase family protein [Patescibacteria group bacterium]